MGRRTRTRRGRTRRRVLWTAAILATAAIGAGAALAWRDLVVARRDLEAARGELAGVASDPSALATAEGRSRALARAGTAVQRARGAHAVVRNSRPLRAAGMLPGLGVQRDGLLQLVSDADDAATAGRDLLEAFASLAQDTPVEAGRLPLEAMDAVEGEVRSAASEFRRVRRGRRGLFGPLGDARVTLDELAVATAGRLETAAVALAAGRSFAGETGIRRHFVAGLNNAEMRDQGMLLSYAVLQFDRGAFSIERSGPIHELALERPAAIDTPSGTQILFGDLDIVREWRSVNATADFPWSAHAMVAMYEEATGDRLDGVIAVDAVVLQGLLAVTGAIHVDGLGTVSAANAVEVLLARQYDGMGVGVDHTARREQVADVATMLVRALQSGRHDPVALGQRLGHAAEGRHLRLWSADAAEEEAFERVGLGGGPALEAAHCTFHVAIQNANGTKLDYEIRPSVRLEIDITGAGSAVVRTTVTITNHARPDVGPSYVRGVDGSYVGRVYLWGPAGASQPGSVEDAGLLANQEPVLAAAAERASVSFETVIPNAVQDGELCLRLVPQPRHTPTRLHVDVHAPRWRLDEREATLSVDWDKTLNLRWKLTPRP